MSPLLDLVVNAHGGLARWNTIQNLQAKMTIAGALWEAKQKTGLLAQVTFESSTRDQDRIVIRDFAGKGNRSVFSPEKIRLENSSGSVMMSRDNPRAAFDASPWDELHAAYFCSYAAWNYLTQPFLYTYPGFRTEEVAPRTENGEKWRGLKIIYPMNIVGHCLEQISYFGKDGLLRRHDYSVDVLGGATGANYASDYREIQGIMIPMKRRIFGRSADGQKIPEPLLISIDISEIRFD